MNEFALIPSMLNIWIKTYLIRITENSFLKLGIRSLLLISSFIFIVLSITHYIFVIKDFANQQEIHLKQIALPFRAAITGTTISPGIFEVAKILGQQETMGRLKDVAEI